MLNYFLNAYWTFRHVASPTPDQTLVARPPLTRSPEETRLEQHNLIADPTIVCEAAPPLLPANA
jgi:hypothetical protein